MKRVSIVAVLMGLLSIFATPFAAPASAAAAKCHIEIEEAGIIRHPDGHISAAAWQRCTGTFTHQSVKVMLQKYVVHNDSGYWRIEAQNAERTVSNYKRVVVRKTPCNDRARVSKWRVVATGTVQVGRVPNGRSVIHPEVRWLRC